MAIDLDIDSITDVGSLSSAISSSLSTQISSFTGSVSGNLGKLVMGSGETCDIFGAAVGMARFASDGFKSSFKELTKNVQGAFASVASLAGSMIKSVSGTIGLVQQKLSEFSAWLATQAESLLDSAKSILNSLKSVINSSFSAVSSVMSSCMSFFSGIKENMFDAVSILPVRSCKLVADSIRNIGVGAGIDSIANLISEPDYGKFSEMALSGLTGSLGGILNSVNDVVGDIPDPNNTNSQLSSIMSNIDSLMGT